MKRDLQMKQFIIINGFNILHREDTKRFLLKMLFVTIAFIGMTFNAFATPNYVYHVRSTDAVWGCGTAKFVDILSPNSSQSVLIGFKIEFQNYWNQARIYYTTDGTTPSGSKGIASGTTIVVSASYQCGSGSPASEVVTGTIPPQPQGTIVKYIVSAWHSGGGDEIFANGGDDGNHNASTKATVYSYTVQYMTAQAGNWSNANTWSGGNTPPSGSLVTLAHNVTLDANVTISSLTINSGITFTASDNSVRTLTISNSVSSSFPTLSNNGTWANGPGGSNVIFTGAPSSGDAVHAISGTITFQNISVNKTGGSSNVGVSFGAGSTVSGTVEIGSGGFVSTAPPASFYGANAILKFNQGTGATYNVGGSDFTWSTTVIPNFITISSGTVNLNAERTATGNLLIDGGTLALSAGLTIQGNWTRTSGTFTPNSQTVTLSGSTNTIINTVTDASLYNLIISKTGSGSVSLSSNLTVTHDLTISGGVLTVPASKNLTVAGVFANSVATGIVLESASGSVAPGSLITNGSVTGTGTLKAERYIPAYTGPADGWHLISSPVSNPALTATNLTPGTNDDFYFYNEPTYEWLNQKVSGNNITAMANGTGYLVSYQSASPTKYIVGTPNNAAVTLTNLSYTTATPVKGKGWHIAGNPFPCAIKWNNGSYTRTNVGGVAKKMSNTGGFSDISENGVIPAMQGFYVQVSEGSNTLTIPLNARTHDAASWTKSSETNNILITANDLESQMMQESWIRINDQATEGYDQEYDSHFLPFYAPQFYSKSGDEMFSTNSLPSLSSESVIPFGFVKNDASNFSIELKQSIDGLTVNLKDLKTNTNQNLSENPVYTFTSEAGDDPNRFILSFLNPTGTSKPTAAQIKVYSTTGKINITGVDGKADIIVRNMLGQVVQRSTLSGSTLQSIDSGKLQAGVYVVSVVSGKQTVSGKVVVK